MRNEFKFMLNEIVDFRELFYYLTLKEIRVKYKQSIIGIGWALLMPLISMVIFTFIFTRVAKVETDVPYPIFVYCGLLPWQLFAPPRRRIQYKRTTQKIAMSAWAKRSP